MDPKRKKQFNSFARKLDTYRTKYRSQCGIVNNRVPPEDMIDVINSANFDFYTHQYNSPLYTGDCTTTSPKLHIYSMPFYANPYTYSQHPLYREPVNPVNGDTIESLCDSLQYNPFGKASRQFHFSPPTPIPTPTEMQLHALPPKKKVDISVSVSSLSDLIHIVNTYPYDDACEYNIDLKSLVNIRDELIQLDNMIGMKQLKQSITEQLLYFIQELHISSALTSTGERVKTHEFKHTVIYGPPGTGKTEIAKIIGKMYSKIGVLEKNVFKKTTRNDFIAGYLGQTAIKTKALINECIGGVLFIDEAYSLAHFSNGDLDSYSKECMDILCEALSDHKHDLMVIIAGYEDELDASFFLANTGLKSRFIWRFKIDEYSAAEMREIWLKMVGESDWRVDADTIPVKWFEDKKKSFAHYGRDMEMLFTYTKVCHSKRIYGKPNSLRKILTIEDVDAGYNVFTKHKQSAKSKDNYALCGLYV